jgi:hypothetical protein
MSDIGSQILTKLIQLFFTPIPSLNNQTGWSILATQLTISPGGITTHIDPMDLSGIRGSDGNRIEILETTIDNDGCGEWYDFVNTSPCAGVGIKIELGVLNGLAGMVINPNGGSIITTPIANGFQFQIPVIIPSVKMTGAEWDTSIYPGPFCKCYDSPEQIAGNSWLGWGDFPDFLLTSAVPSTAVATITINYTISGNTLTLLLAESTWEFSNMVIGIFSDWCTGIPGIPCIPVSNLNGDIGSLIEGQIPSDLLSSMSDVTIPFICPLQCANGSTAKSDCSSCTCQGNWTGTTCSTCGLCQNGSTPDSTCSSCSTCPGNWDDPTCSTCLINVFPPGCPDNYTTSSDCTGCCDNNGKCEKLICDQNMALCIPKNPREKFMMRVPVSRWDDGNYASMSKAYHMY